MSTWGQGGRQQRESAPVYQRGTYLLFSTLPGPAPFDFQLQCHAEESTDQDDQAKYQDVFQCGSDNDCSYNVACDEELETQQDSPSQVLPEESVWLPRPPMPTDEESASGKDRSDDYHKNPDTINRHPDTTHQLTVECHHTPHDIRIMKLMHNVRFQGLASRAGPGSTSKHITQADEASLSSQTHSNVNRNQACH